MKTLFIFGLGYSASLFAKQALEKGWQVRGTIRSLENAKKFTDLGIEIFQFDGETPITEVQSAFKGVTHILHSIPPHKETGDPVYNHHIQDLESLASLEWFGYLSTTGVYGNHDGATVNEQSARTPTSARAEARKQAEDNWLESDIPSHLFRLAGIYGPTRNSFEQIRKGRGRIIDKPGHIFSRIHIEDIAGILWASVHKPNPKSAYNACDNQACEPSEVLSYAYTVMGQEAPAPQPFDEAAKEMTPMALTFWQDNKRVDNTLLSKELEYELKYPGYKKALDEIWEQENK